MSAVTPRPQQLHAAAHWRVEAPFAMDAASTAAQIDLAGRLVGHQLRETLQAVGFDAELLLVTSTVMSAAVTMQAQGQAVFYDAIEHGCGLRPEGILNAYMCTGWGYALRYCMRHTAVRRVAIAIVDLDPHNLAWQQNHPVIGPSGFGVTTLLFTLPEARDGTPHCSGPHANSAFNDLLMALRLHQARHDPLLTFVPFMLPGLASTAQRVLGQSLLAPNRNEEFGHCFGADPWIGIVEWFASHGLGQTQTVLAGALAFNGYLTFAPVTLGPQTRLQLRRLQGDVASLERALAGTAADTPLNPPREELETHA